MGIWLRIHPDRFCLPANRAGTGPRRTLVPYPKDDEWDGGTKTPSLAVLDHSTGINAGQRGPGGRVRPIVGGGSVRPRALSAPYTADFDAFPCMSCFRFASYNAVTSGNAFVEVGGVEPAGGICVTRRSEDILPGQGIFLGVPVDVRLVPWKPGKCVKRVSPCQECVNECT